jgi:hypothetical protein
MTQLNDGLSAHTIAFNAHSAPLPAYARSECPPFLSNVLPPKSTHFQADSHPMLAYHLTAHPANVKRININVSYDSAPRQFFCQPVKRRKYVVVGALDCRA